MDNACEALVLKHTFLKKCKEGNKKQTLVFQKWSTDHHFNPAELEMSLEGGVVMDPDTAIGSSEVSSAPTASKPLWKRNRPVRKYYYEVLFD